MGHQPNQTLSFEALSLTQVTFHSYTFENNQSASAHREPVLKHMVKLDAFSQLVWVETLMR